MPQYRYVVADLKTGTVRDEVPFAGATFGQQLSGAPQFSANAPVDLATRTVQTRLYDAMIHGDRPEGYWRLNDAEGAATAEDISGNGYDGDYLGEPLLGQPGAIADDPDTAIHSDGDTGYMQVSGLPDVGGAHSFTIEHWAAWLGNADATTRKDGLRFRGISEEDADRPGATEQHWFAHVNGKWRFWWRTIGSWTFIESLETTPDVGTVVHLAATWDGSTVRFYQDGIEQGTSTAQPVHMSATRITTSLGGTTPIEQLVDEVAFYRRALTAGAIKRHYDRGLLDPKRVVRTHRPLESIEAARSIIYVERGGIIVGDGIVWDPRKDPGSRDLQVQGAGLASYLSRRRIRNTRDYQGVDLGLVAKDLVDWAQGNGDLSYGTTAGPAAGDVGIDTSAVVEVGVDHFRTWPAYERKVIGEALAELDALENGIDWWIGVEGGGGTFSRVMRLWHPRRERLTDLVYEWGTNIDDYGVSHQGSNAANLVDAIGQGEGRDMKVRTRQDAGALDAYPQLDEILSMKDTTQTSDLADAAGEMIRRRSTPPIVPTLTVRVGRGTRYGMWALGDRVRVRIDDGWVQVDGLFRVVAWTVTVDAEHNETVNLTVEAA